MSRLVFLIGLSGCGKSTVGRLLADRLGVPLLDTDAEIERLADQPVPQIFSSRGEPAFRALECEVVARACELPAAVVATGGGAVLDPGSRERIHRAGAVVWLDAPVPELAARLQAGGNPGRPLLAGDVVSSLERLQAERKEIYAAIGQRVDVAGRPPAEVVDCIMETLHPSGDRPRPSLPPQKERAASRPPLAPEGAAAGQPMGAEEGTLGPPPVWVRAPSQTYPVYVDPGLLGRAGELLRLHGIEGRLCVIADERVAALHGDALRAGLGDWPQAWYPIPAGEEHKTLDQATELFDRLLQARPERRDVIVAFGGGVIGDLAGFVAATLLRGLRFVQLPTTVLSQVDSSVGGKVGVDHPRGKNLIGAFHQPSLVLADLDVLRTLPPREIAAGWAEVVKIAVIQDAALFEEMEASVPPLRGVEPMRAGRAIRRAIELKARLVEQDERDLAGLRAILNYGHTLGHALEAATEYAALLHGEAVAIGMAGAAHIAHRLGGHPAEAVERQTRLLRQLGLPQHCAGVSGLALRDAMGLDKKRDQGRVLWILPDGLGRVRTTQDVPADLVDAAIDLITQAPSSVTP